jgi:hypothetical protein
MSNYICPSASSVTKEPNAFGSGLLKAILNLSTKSLTKVSYFDFRNGIAISIKIISLSHGNNPPALFLIDFVFKLLPRIFILWENSNTWGVSTAISVLRLKHYEHNIISTNKDKEFKTEILIDIF